MDTIRYYMPGVILILLAVLIVAVPQILIAFIASVFIMAGLGALYIGHKFRKAEQQLGRSDDWFFDEDFFGRRFAGRPVFRNWSDRF